MRMNLGVPSIVFVLAASASPGFAAVDNERVIIERETDWVDPAKPIDVSYRERRVEIYRDDDWSSDAANRIERDRKRLEKFEKNEEGRFEKQLESEADRTDDLNDKFR